MYDIPNAYTANYLKIYEAGFFSLSLVSFLVGVYGRRTHFLLFPFLAGQPGVSV